MLDFFSEVIICLIVPLCVSMEMLLRDRYRDEVVCFVLCDRPSKELLSNTALASLYNVTSAATNATGIPIGPIIGIATQPLNLASVLSLLAANPAFDGLDAAGMPNQKVSLKV